MSATVRWNRDPMDRLRRGVRDGLNAVALEFQRTITAQLSMHGSTRALGNVPAPAGSSPAAQSGHLRRSWGPSAVIDRTNLDDPTRPRIRIGSNLVYAAIHEYGGTIHGKPGLLIPISPDAKRASAQGLLQHKGDAARVFPGMIFVKRPGRSPALIRVLSKANRRGGHKGDIEFMFSILRQVTLPPRPYIKPAIESLRPLIPGIFSRFLNRALGGRAA